MEIPPLPPLSSPVPVGAAAASDGQNKVKDAAGAAKQFEALLIAQMLRTAHESTGGSLDDGDSSSSNTIFDIAGQQFAQVLANNGGLGLAKMITEGLRNK
jgi:Rod binding domain-containing protein